MCGFVLARAIDPAARIDAGAFTQMTRSLAARGPDNEGLLIDDRLALGFRRLSILDLSEAAHQPMTSIDGRYSILFNGEIFNYLELRRELEALGHPFRSTGDTEVLLNAFTAWGPDCARRLNGMWAYLIVDHRTGLIHGSRDRFGIKPLHYAGSRQGFVFASEIKAIVSSGIVSGLPNDVVIARWLLEDRLDQDGTTFIEGIERVPAGFNLTLHPDGQLVFDQYWNLEEESRTAAASDADLPTRFAELFENAVDLTLRSDVPVGVNLSGGLDSTAIFCAAARLLRQDRDRMLAFSFLPDEFGEGPLARETVDTHGGRLVELQLSPERYWDTLPALIATQDEPVHSMTAVVGYHLYALARAHGVPVVLIGQGADETIGGYPSYFRDHWYSLLVDGKLAHLLKEVDGYQGHHGGSRAGVLIPLLVHTLKSQLRRASLYKQLAQSRRLRDLAATPWVSRRLIAAITTPSEPSPPDLPGSLRYSIQGAPLPLYLRVEDRNSMAHSVEARLPFLDHRLVSLALAADERWHLSGPLNKFLLREAMRGKIPESVRGKVDKLGFPTSFADWLRGPMGEKAEQLIRDAEGALGPYVDSNRICEMLRRHRRGVTSAAPTVFAGAQLALWLAQLSSLRQAVHTPVFYRTSGRSNR